MLHHQRKASEVELDEISKLIAAGRTKVDAIRIVYEKKAKEGVRRSISSTSYIMHQFNATIHYLLWYRYIPQRIEREKLKDQKFLEHHL